MATKALGITAIVFVVVVGLVLMAPGGQRAADTAAISLRAEGSGSAGPARDDARAREAGTAASVGGGSGRTAQSGAVRATTAPPATDSEPQAGDSDGDLAALVAGDVDGGAAGIGIAGPAEPAASGDPVLDRALQVADPDHEIPSNPRLQATVRQFQAEVDDPLWAQATEAQIYGEISRVLGLRLGRVDADCRVTLCRIELTGANFGAPGVAAERLPDVLAGLDLDTMFMFVLAGANGDRHAVAYLKRKGVTIPQSSSAEVVAAG